jgi:hypothetical protein
MRILSGLVALGLSASLAQAWEIALDQSDDKRQICAGMYSRKSWGGPVDPFILVDLIKPSDIPDGQDPVVSLLLFEWTDKMLIGIPNENIPGPVSDAV